MKKYLLLHKGSFNDTFRHNTLVLFMAMLISFLYSVSFVLSNKVFFIGIYSPYSINIIKGLDSYSYFELIYYFFIAIGSIIIYFFINRRILFHNTSANIKSNNTYLYAGLLFTLWLPFFLTFYPGSGLTDTIHQMFHLDKYIVQHPWFHCLFLITGKKLGIILNDAELGFAIIMMAQMLFFAITISFALKWLYARGCPKAVAFLLLCYYGFTPIIINMSFTGIKDSLYACFIMLFIPVCYNLIQSNTYKTKLSKLWIPFLLTLAGILLLRNNGNQVIIAFLGVSVLILRHNSINVFKYSLALILLCALPNLFLAIFYDKEQKFVEAVGVPLQQVAAIVVNDGQLTMEEQRFFGTIYPIYGYYQEYRPLTIDNIKESYMFNGEFLQHNKAEFIKKWLGLVRRYPEIAFKAQLLETYGFWSVTTARSNQGSFLYALSKISLGTGKYRISQYEIGKAEFLRDINKIKFIVSTHNFIPLDLRMKLGKFMAEHNGHLPVGLSALIVMVCMLDLYRRNKSKYILCLTPLFFNWAVMLVAAPIAFAYRYVFSFSLCLPLALLLPYLDDSSANTEAAEAVDTTAGECKADTGTEA